MKIDIYTKRNCGWCVLTKQYLTSKNMEYKDFVLGEDVDIAEFKRENPDALSVPQIFIDNLRIGGYTDLVRYLDNNTTATTAGENHDEKNQKEE